MTQHEPFESILGAAAAGAEWAWGRIFGDLDSVLRAYVRRQGGADVDGLVGEVWLHVARGIGRFRGDEPAFRSWVFMIAHSRLLDERRVLHRRPLELTGTSVPDSSARTESSAEAHAIRHLDDERLQKILDQLTPDQREVIVLRFVVDMQLTDIATVVGKPTGAVHALQRRALRRLEKILGDDRTFSG